MRKSRIGLSVAGIFAISLVIGCNARLPGQPTEADRWRAPADISDFNQLYTQNCAGCHGAGGRLGAARPLNDPLYLSYASDEVLREAISKGRIGTNMPPFSQQTGGSLTEEQIELLIKGMRTQWSSAKDFNGIELPPYSVNPSPPGNGDAVIVTNNTVSSIRETPGGAAAYQTYCARCHGPDGAGGPAGSIVDPNFLNMVSDQSLRTTVVVGRSDLGKPDWRSNIPGIPGRPMSPQEIEDVVVWVAAHRKTTRATAEGITQSSRLNP